MTIPVSGPCVFSPDRKHRFALWRDLKLFNSLEFEIKPGYCMFVGLNPSTADETRNDPTVARCIKYAMRWGFEQFLMTNIFAYRATDPSDMKKFPDPIGAENDYWLSRLAADAGMVVCAWGSHGAYLNRGPIVQSLLARIQPLHCLTLTKDGFPGHPLYLRSDLKPVIFQEVVPPSLPA
jgi:hypothetical protein